MYDVQWQCSIQKNINTLPNLRSSHVPEDLAQVIFCSSWNWVYVWSTVHLHEWKSDWNPKSDTPDLDRPQHDDSAACVITQQYSSTTFIPLPYNHFESSFLLWWRNLYHKQDRFHPKMKGAQMRFLRQVLGFTVLDSQRTLSSEIDWKQTRYWKIWKHVRTR
jgi:hypothetical protein